MQIYDDVGSANPWMLLTTFTIIVAIPVHICFICFRNRVSPSSVVVGGGGGCHIKQGANGLVR